MFKFLKKKDKTTNNSHLILKTAALLIHTAKIDENYSSLEKKIIRDTILILDPEINDVEKLMSDVKMRDEMKAFKSPVNGKKIMETLDLKEGVKIGLIKNKIEDAILESIIPNTYEDAFEYMMKIKDKVLKD